MGLKIGIVAFAFGVPHSTLANQRIAETARYEVWRQEREARYQGFLQESSLEIHCQIFTQRDVQFNVRIERTSIEVLSAGDITYIEEEPDGPPPTLRIARGAVEWAKQRRIGRLWVVAAKPHLWRCVRDLEYAICEADAHIKVSVGEEIKQSLGKWWFDPGSTQKRVHSFWRWWPREIILRLMPMAIYKRVAG